MPFPLLRLNNITKSFGAVRALKGVSFDLQPGEVHALVGENGAGKSTLMKVITGAERPDAGSIEIAGQQTDHLSPALAHKLGVACIYQQPALFPDLSVAENVRLRLDPARPFERVDWRAGDRRAREILASIGANVSPTREVRCLSMPEQQLVEIACACGVGARVVIMDEPTASLTQKEQHLLFAVVRKLRESGTGVIYISHRLEEVFALADRVTVLRDGESVATNPAADLTEELLIRLMVGREVTQIYPPGESQPGEAVLKLQRVGCSATGIRDTTLEVRAGEIVGLAGLVGAGRTELARVLFGITPADSGEIALRGKTALIDSPAAAIAQGIAYVPEDRRRHGVILDLPIANNISMAILRRLFPSGWLRFSAERELALHFIDRLRIKTEAPEALASSLSGGNQQKVSLARWLATEPKVLILDEPTQGVDVGAKSEIHKIIRELAGQGVAVLLISSELPEVLAMSDRIAVMREGTIIAVLPGKSAGHEVMAAAFGRVDAVDGWG
jgi:rhamnose transport system ATP-binding protein